MSTFRIVPLTSIESSTISWTRSMLIARVALDNQAQLASADQGFADVPGLQLLIPGTVEFAERLSR